MRTVKLAQPDFIAAFCRKGESSGPVLTCFP